MQVCVPKTSGLPVFDAEMSRMAACFNLQLEP